MAKLISQLTAGKRAALLPPNSPTSCFCFSWDRSDLTEPGAKLAEILTCGGLHIFWISSMSHPPLWPQKHRRVAGEHRGSKKEKGFPLRQPHLKANFEPICLILTIHLFQSHHL